MKTIVVIEVHHRKPIPELRNMIAGRAYSIDGVTNTEVVKLPSMTMQELQEEGFTLSEISLGQSEVERS